MASAVRVFVASRAQSQQRRSMCWEYHVNVRHGSEFGVLPKIARSEAVAGQAEFRKAEGQGALRVLEIEHRDKEVVTRLRRVRSIPPHRAAVRLRCCGRSAEKHLVRSTVWYRHECRRSIMLSNPPQMPVFGTPMMQRILASWPMLPRHHWQRHEEHEA